jgi:hypothetical protein
MSSLAVRRHANTRCYAGNPPWEREIPRFAGVVSIGARHICKGSTIVEKGQERQAHPLVVGCSIETGSDAGKVFLRASSSASSWRLRLSLSPSS